MKELDLPPFYIGQRVVAIRDIVTHLKLAGTRKVQLKKGEVVTVLGLKKCCQWRIDIGLDADLPVVCPKCSDEFNDSVIWPLASYFVPEEHTFQSITLEKVLDNETEWINAN